MTEILYYVLMKYQSKGGLMKFYKKAVIKKFLHELKTPYNSEGRVFHTMEHIALGLREMSDYSEWHAEHSYTGSEISVNQIYAWLFHDVYYNAQQPALNEEKSADIACERLKDLKGVDCEIVRQIILDTKDHKATIEESKLVLDVDMVSLGYQYDVFLKYRKKAWEEYSLFYDERSLKMGTILFIENTLNHDKLYNLDYFIDKYEKQARENLKKYLENLKK